MLNIIVYFVFLTTNYFNCTLESELTDATLYYVSFRLDTNNYVQIIMIKAEVESTDDSPQYNLFKNLQFTHFSVKATESIIQFIQIGKGIPSKPIQNLLEDDLKQAKEIFQTEIRPIVYKFSYSEKNKENDNKLGNFESEVFYDNNIHKYRGFSGLSLRGNHFVTDNSGILTSLERSKKEHNNKNLKNDKKEIKENFASITFSLETQKTLKKSKDNTKEILHFKPVGLSLLNAKSNVFRNDEKFYSMNFAIYNNKLVRNIITDLDVSKQTKVEFNNTYIYNLIEHETETWDDEEERKNAEEFVEWMFNTPKKVTKSTYDFKPKTYFLSNGFFIEVYNAQNPDNPILTQVKNVIDSKTSEEEETITYNDFPEEKRENFRLKNFKGIEIDIKMSFKDNKLITKPLLFKTYENEPKVYTTIKTNPTGSKPGKSIVQKIKILGILLFVLASLSLVGVIGYLRVKRTKKYMRRRKH